MLTHNSTSYAGPLDWTETRIYELENGKIEELWSGIGFLTIMIRIGAIPAQ